MIPFSQDSLLVLVALGLAALLALLTVLAMMKGARLKRARKAADEEEQARIDGLRDDGVEEGDVGDGSGSFTDAPDRTAASTLAPGGQRTGHADAPTGPAHAPIASEPRLSDEPQHAPPIADEPIAAAAPLDASPASVAADAPVGTAPAEPATATSGGSITQLKGLGPKIAARLGELGITTVDQLAWLDDGEAAQLDAQLGAFQGRMERDRWREQARFLAQGDRAGYEAQFGKLG